MAQTVKRKSQNKSKAFPITISVIVLAMIAIVAFSIVTDNKKSDPGSKLEISDAVSVVPASIDGKLGESTLPDYTNEIAASGKDPAVGLIVPEFTAQQFDGNSTTVTPGNKPYVVAIVAHWCQHCRKEVPAIVKLHDEGKLPSDVEFIAVSTDTHSTGPKAANYPPSSWLFNAGWPWRKVADDEQGKVASAFGLTGFPYLIFVNADGTVSARMSGEKDDSIYIAAAEVISGKN